MVAQGTRPADQNTPSRPTATSTPGSNDDDHHSVWGWIILAVLLALIVAGVGWYAYAHLRARRLGLQPPRLNPFSDRNRITENYPARSGVVGWIQSKFKELSNRRTARGDYEGTALSDGTRVGGRGARAGTAGFGRLDPDEAWDTRVGNEADYYEEQELGLHEPVGGPDGAYGGSGYGRSRGYGPSAGLDEIERNNDGRGRSRAREDLDERFDEQMQGKNPFETAEQSTLRGISPRPHQEPVRSVPHHQHNRSLEDSPTERRSMFHEEM